jgi:hypothetical protein
MPHAVKLSDALVADAKAAAAQEDRSIAGQIEHWARLGRAVEQDLAPPALSELARRSTAGEATSASLAGQLAAAVEHAMQPASRQELADALAQRVRYGTDPAFPGYVVRDEPGGQRTPGRFVNREFRPLRIGDADD